MDSLRNRKSKINCEFSIGLKIKAEISNFRYVLIANYIARGHAHNRWSLWSRYMCGRINHPTTRSPMPYDAHFDFAKSAEFHRPKKKINWKEEWNPTIWINCLSWYCCTRCVCELRVPANSRAPIAMHQLIRQIHDFQINWTRQFTARIRSAPIENCISSLAYTILCASAQPNTEEWIFITNKHFSRNIVVFLYQFLRDV